MDGGSVGKLAVVFTDLTITTAGEVALHLLLQHQEEVTLHLHPWYLEEGALHPPTNCGYNTLGGLPRIRGLQH